MKKGLWDKKAAAVPPQKVHSPKVKDSEMGIFT
jgi:hypothetical protein